MKRNYEIPLTGRVSVDATEGTVAVEVDLADLPLDLTYDYEVPYTDAEVTEDGAAIQDCFMQSPTYLAMSLHMVSK